MVPCAKLCPQFVSSSFSTALLKTVRDTTQKGETYVSNNTIRRSLGLVFVFAVCVVFVCADLVVSSAKFVAQNSNSSMTQEDETTRGGMMTSKSTMGTANKATTRRRRNRRTQAAATQEGMSSGSASTRETSADPAAQTDLSGTYTGTVNYPEGGLNGPATVVITGNNFVLTPDEGGGSIPGRVTAVTTRGYIAVTMMFGDTTPPPVTQSPPPLPAVSLRARIVGGHVMMTSVEGEKREFTFTSSAAASVGRKRTRKIKVIKPPT